MWWLVAIVGMGLLYDAYVKKKDHELKIKQLELELKKERKKGTVETVEVVDVIPEEKH